MKAKTLLQSTCEAGSWAWFSVVSYQKL